MSSDDTLHLVDDTGGAPELERLPDWKLLVVDDDEEVHTITRMVLDDFLFDGRGLEFLHAYSGTEARELLQANKDVAVILLDVVMETADAGLRLASQVREEDRNHLVRIILRTGQAGQAPEREVITRYEINDYKQKTELTAQKLFTVVTTALRSYRELMTIEEQRRGLRLLSMAVADQVRNRMLSIGGYASLLMEDVQVPRNALDQLKIIKDESARLEDTVRVVADYAGLPDPRPMRLNSSDLLARAMRGAETVALELGRTITWQPPTHSCDIYADQDLMLRALAAVLRNSVEFATADPAPIALEVHENDYDLRLCVSDQGPGIPANRRSASFEPFFTTKPFGTGMGLFTARRVIEAHQGGIYLSDNEHGGLTVCISLPKAFAVAG